VFGRGGGTTLIVEAVARVASGSHASVASESAGASASASASADVIAGMSVPETGASASADVIAGMFITETGAGAHTRGVCCSGCCSGAVITGE
jgi:nitrous oxidase accessory protein NosD